MLPFDQPPARSGEVKAHELSKFNVGSGDDPLLRQADICKVLNQSGGTLDRFSVVELSDALITPQQNATEFQTRAAFRVILPTSKAKGKFGVLLEPIPTGRIGRVWASGVCPALVNVIDEKHRYCEAVTGLTLLRSDCFGSARILWRETGLGLKWALIRLGNRDDMMRMRSVSIAPHEVRSPQPAATECPKMKPHDPYLLGVSVRS